MEVLNLGLLDAVIVALPPLHEQDRLRNGIRSANDSATRTRDAVQRQVDTLREYRQALISAAVTGQIDVSNEAA
jgi:type I restriction enzyme S subunit